jgi:5'-methylthioadenosine phosphorylase
VTPRNAASAGPRIGVIGGSGFDALADRVVGRQEVDTPYGRPSGPVSIVEVDGEHIAFLARHGAGHVLPPHRVPYRANLFAMRRLGVQRVVGVNAVGSLAAEIAPGDLAIPDDLFDRTTARDATFYDAPGLVGHVNVAPAFCDVVRGRLLAHATAVPARVHAGGTLVVIQGPRFSTRAESEFHRGLGLKLVGMTTLPEATLARELGLCYATISLVTDYDVWHGASEPVTVEAIVSRLATVTDFARTLFRAALPDLLAAPACDHGAAEAIVTDPTAADTELLRRILPTSPAGVA